MYQEYYQCQYRHCMPCCSYIMSRQSPPLNWLPATKRPCPSTVLKYHAFLQLAQKCNGNFIWVCFTNKLQSNNGWWRLNGVSSDEKQQRIILTLERPNNNVQNFEYKVDIISIVGPCEAQPISGPSFFPSGLPLSKNICFPHAAPLKYQTFLQLAQKCNGNFIWVCFTDDENFNNGWWRLNAVSSDEKQQRIILTLERPNNNVQNFEYKADIVSIGPCIDYKEKVGQIPSPPLESPLFPCTIYYSDPVAIMTNAEIFNVAKANLSKIVCIGFNNPLTPYNGYWYLIGLSGNEKAFTITLSRNTFKMKVANKNIFSITYIAP